MLKTLIPTLSIIFFVTGANAVTPEDISQLTPTEVASLTCNSIKSLELDPIQYLVREKDFNKMVKENMKNPEKFKELVKNINCTITDTKRITQKSGNKTSYTEVSFEQFSKINVFKVEEEYRIVIQG